MKQLRMESTHSNGKTFQEWDPSFIRALKDRVDEGTDDGQQNSFYEKNYPSIYDLEFLQQNMYVIPVPFSKEHKHMLAHAKNARVSEDGAQVGIVTKDATSGAHTQSFSPESTCLYKRLFLDYTDGLNKIYTGDEITAAK